MSAILGCFYGLSFHSFFFFFLLLQVFLSYLISIMLTKILTKEGTLPEREYLLVASETYHYFVLL